MTNAHANQSLLIKLSTREEAYHCESNVLFKFIAKLLNFDHFEMKMFVSDKLETVQVKNFEKFEDENELDFGEKFVARENSNLATALRSGVIRPLSPTLKVHSPEEAFPGIAVLCEGFDGMDEWKNTINFVGFFAKNANKNGMGMFNSEHHQNMRTKVLDARLRRLERICEDTSEVKPSTGLVSIYQANIDCDEEEYVFAKKDGDTTTPTACEETKDETIHKFQLENENTSEKVQPDTSDEKQQRESLQKGLGIETRCEVLSLPVAGYESDAPTLYNAVPDVEVPENDVTNKNVSADMEELDISELMVIGKSIPVGNDLADPENSKREVATNSELSRENEEKLVLEDINDKDLVSEILLPSPQLLVTATNSGEGFVTEQTATQKRTVSGFRRLRRRIGSLFSRFRKNRVTPVNF